MYYIFFQKCIVRAFKIWYTNATNFDDDDDDCNLTVTMTTTAAAAPEHDGSKRDVSSPVQLKLVLGPQRVTYSDRSDANWAPASHVTRHVFSELRDVTSRLQFSSVL